MCVFTCLLRPQRLGQRLVQQTLSDRGRRARMSAVCSDSKSGHSQGQPSDSLQPCAALHFFFPKPSEGGTIITSVHGTQG